MIGDRLERARERLEVKRAESEGRSTASDPVIRAGEDVLGRTIDVDSAEYTELSNLGDYSTITQHLSLSAEARGLGVNPLDWGNTVVDPETLSGEELEQYEAWSQYNSGPYYSGNQEFMGWVGNRGSLDVYHAEQQGLITQEYRQTDDGDWVSITTVSQPAVDRFGADNLTFSGRRVGEIIVSPADSIQIDYADSLDGDWVPEGMVAHGTTGKPSKGLIRGTVGGFIESAVPKEFHLVADPLGLTTGPLFGQRVDERARTSLEPIGVSSRNVTRAQHAGRSAAQVALMGAGPLGWVGAAGVGLADAESNRVRYGGSRSDWMINAGEQYAVNAIGAVAGPFAAIGGQMALDYSKGGERRAGMFENAAWNVANRYTMGAAAFGRAAMDSDYSMDDATFAFAQAAATSMRDGDGFSWDGDRGVFSNIGSNVRDLGTQNIRSDFQDPQTGEWSFVPDGSRTNPFSSDTYSGDAVAGRLGLVPRTEATVSTRVEELFDSGRQIGIPSSRESWDPEISVSRSGIDWGQSTRQGARNVSRILGAPYAPHRWAWDRADGAVDWATDTDRPWRRSPPAEDMSFVPGEIEERIFA